MQSATPSFMVTASGWAPPMPPSPAVSTTRPRRLPLEVLTGQLREGLVGALQDALAADVDPRPGGHLPVHREAGALELAERLPVRPVPHQVAVGDEDPRCPLVGAEDGHRLARGHQQRLVVGEGAQFAHDGVEGSPGASGAAGATVDDEVVRALRDLRVEVVHEHAQRGFLAPAAARQLAARGVPARGVDRS